MCFTLENSCGAVCWKVRREFMQIVHFEENEWKLCVIFPAATNLNDICKFSKNLVLFTLGQKGIHANCSNWMNIPSNKPQYYLQVLKNLVLFTLSQEGIYANCSHWIKWMKAQFYIFQRSSNKPQSYLHFQGYDCSNKSHCYCQVLTNLGLIHSRQTTPSSASASK